MAAIKKSAPIPEAKILEARRAKGALKMTQRSYRETGRFKLVGEDGSQYTAIETTTFLHAHSHSGSSMVPGLKDLRTTDGYHVNFDGEKEYTIVELGLKAKRADER